MALIVVVAMQNSPDSSVIPKRMVGVRKAFGVVADSRPKRQFETLSFRSCFLISKI